MVSRLSQDLQAALQVSTFLPLPSFLCQSPALPSLAAPTDQEPVVLPFLLRTMSCRQTPIAAPWRPPRPGQPPRDPEWLPCRRASRRR